MRSSTKFPLQRAECNSVQLHGRVKNATVTRGLQKKRPVCGGWLAGCRVLALLSVVVECVVAAKTNDEVGKTHG
jgi:hypothetical protein